MPPEDTQNGIDDMMRRYAAIRTELTVSRDRMTKLGKSLAPLATLISTHPQYVVFDNDEVRASDGSHRVRFEDLDPLAVRKTLEDYRDTAAEAKRLYEALKEAGLGKVVTPPKLT